MDRAHADALPKMARTYAAARRATAGAISPFAVARRALSASFERLLLWQDRATQRHHLSMAEDPMLEDIGLTRAEVAREIKKPFWRP
jgi:uncharacterized protein YjiS (DUF1127 family)